MYRVRTHSVFDDGEHIWDCEMFYKLKNAKAFATLPCVIECTIVKLLPNTDMVEIIACNLEEAMAL